MIQKNYFKTNPLDFVKLNTNHYLLFYQNQPSLLAYIIIYNNSQNILSYLVKSNHPRFYKVTQPKANLNIGSNMLTFQMVTNQPQLRINDLFHIKVWIPEIQSQYKVFELKVIITKTKFQTNKDIQKNLNSTLNSFIMPNNMSMSNFSFNSLKKIENYANLKLNKSRSTQEGKDSFDIEEKKGDVSKPLKNIDPSIEDLGTPNINKKKYVFVNKKRRKHSRFQYIVFFFLLSSAYSLKQFLKTQIDFISINSFYYLLYKFLYSQDSKMKQNAYTVLKPIQKLPTQLANSILNLQFQIDTDNIDQEKISKLLSYYSQAISFYWQLRDQRQNFYQQKIKKLFLKKQVQKCLNRSNLLDVTNNNKFATEVQEANSTAYDQAKRLICSYKAQLNEQKQRVTSMLGSQKQNILERVRIRSNSKNKKQKKQKDLKILEREFMEMHLNRS